MSKITYTNKESYSTQPSIDDKYKCTSGDMNEIKNMVNEVGSVQVVAETSSSAYSFSITSGGELSVGDIFTVKFPTLTSTTSAFLKVNGGTAYAIFSSYAGGMGNVSASALSGKTVQLLYTNWRSGYGFQVITPIYTRGLYNNEGYITNTVDNLTNYTKSSDLSAVATSGSYNDLDNKPDLSVYELISNKTTSLSSSSTDTQYPSAKCVYDYIDTIVGDINTALDTINGEVI